MVLAFGEPEITREHAYYNYILNLVREISKCLHKTHNNTRHFYSTLASVSRFRSLDRYSYESLFTFEASLTHPAILISRAARYRKSVGVANV